MILKNLGSIKAALVLLAGVAFFLCSCAKKAPVKNETVEEKPPGKSILHVAEEYLSQGELNKALEVLVSCVAENPHDSRNSACLHKIGEIYLKQGKPQEALQVLQSIQEKFPEYQDMASVKFLVALALRDLEEYENSINLAITWLQHYPDNPLKPNVYFLLGKNFASLGDNIAALEWLLKAYKVYESTGVEDIGRVETFVTKVIEQSSKEDLKSMAVIAKGTRFAPEIFHKVAFLCLQENDLAGAKEAAMALVMSTADEYWVSLGKEILERIEEELSVDTTKIGCLLPLSGPFGIFGQEVLKGLELGMGLFSESEEDTALQLILRDTEGKPELAEVGLGELAKDEKVIAVIGPLRSKSAEVAATLAEQLGVPLITLTQKDGITEKGEMIYRNFISPAREVNRLVRTAIEELALKRFAILYPDNAYGRYFMKLFWETVEELGGEVKAVESYATDQTDFADQIRNMTGLNYPRPKYVMEQLREQRTPEEEENELDPGEKDPIIDFDAVFIPDYYKRVAMVAPQLVYHDIVDVWLLGASQWQSPELIQLSGPYLQGALFTSGFFSENPDPFVQNFVKNFQKSFQTVPTILSANGYDTIRFIRQLLADSEINTRREFQMAISEFPGIEGVTGFISFDPGGEVEKEPFVLTIMGRKMVLFH